MNVFLWNLFGQHLVHKRHFPKISRLIWYRIACIMKCISDHYLGTTSASTSPYPCIMNKLYIEGLVNLIRHGSINLKLSTHCTLGDSAVILDEYFSTHIKTRYLEHLRNCYPVNATRLHLWLINIGPGNSWVSSGNKPCLNQCWSRKLHPINLCRYN